MSYINLPETLSAARDLVNDYVSQDDHDLTKQLLLAMLDHAPTQKGQFNISMEILECANPGANGLMDPATRLQNLAEQYEYRLLIPIVTKGGQTPDRSRRASIEFDTTIDESTVDEKVAMDQEELRYLALCRDKYQSVLSGAVDYESISGGLVPHADNSAVTHVAHILPFYLGRHEVRHEEDALVWTDLAKFSGGLVSATELCGPNIDRLENILTLTSNERSIMGQLIGWLEPEPGQPNTYRMCTESPIYKFPAGKIVRFTSSDPETLPLPNPAYIAIHTACAKVFHASGMEKHLHSMLEDLDSPLLPEDGNSEALTSALKVVVNQ
ncbi:hypothetical protein RSOLAG22IIIB_08884 [Rhizoctonia solani]|uniref:HNH nuclease domain-containing protein n=1 Tax=Rhizoctonia solani TaxID=456999 RepID=A0A0K6FUS7_9AGAM|nr:hypothetical protein RSOLAG22IIIB_08884 [Rhizoctonia solani]